MPGSHRRTTGASRQVSSGHAPQDGLPRRRKSPLFRMHRFGYWPSVTDSTPPFPIAISNTPPNPRLERASLIIRTIRPKGHVRRRPAAIVAMKKPHHVPPARASSGSPNARRKANARPRSRYHRTPPWPRQRPRPRHLTARASIDHRSLAARPSACTLDGLPTTSTRGHHRRPRFGPAAASSRYDRDRPGSSHAQRPALSSFQKYSMRSGLVFIHHGKNARHRRTGRQFIADHIRQPGLVQEDIDMGAQPLPQPVGQRLRP